MKHSLNKTFEKLKTFEEFLNSQDIKTFTNQQSANAKIKYKQLVYLIAWKV